MNYTRRNFLALAGMASALGLAACTTSQPSQPTNDQPSEPQVDLNEFKGLELNQGAWKYDSEHDCYYQLGVKYCLKPANETYESLAIFVPGAYFDAKPNGDTFTCAPKADARVGAFTPKTAPIVMPINSANLAARACPTSYSYDGLGTYLSQGLVYVYAGFRGRSGGYASGSTEMYPGGAPWPAVDLKAAIRFLRYNAEALPVNAERIFSFGYGYGGGVSTVLGASGDSALFTKSLESIGAATHDAKGVTISDRVFGSASWCPITSFDVADSSYEWMMGQFVADGARADGTWTQALSRDLAASYGDYVNQMDLRDEHDTHLTLESVEDGAYLEGSYYDHMIDIIESAANDFFSRTEFPYTETPSRVLDPAFPGDPNLAAGAAAEVDLMAGNAQDAAAATAGAAAASDAAVAGADPSAAQAGVTTVEAKVYDTAASYIAALNSDYRWLTHSSTRNTTRVSGLWDFVTHCRKPDRPVGAFDAADRSTVANQLFGIGDATTLHFDATIASLLSKNHDAYAQAAGWQESYLADWSADVVKKDSLEAGMADRVNAMNPLYHLSGHYAGYGAAAVAPNWRINSGLFQSNVSMTCEANLALALSHFDGVQKVDFTEVWGKGFELAEREGDAQSNFVAWVVSCCPEPTA